MEKILPDGFTRPNNTLISKVLRHRLAVASRAVGPTNFEDPSEALTRLKQTTTVKAYQETFEKLSHRVDNLPEKFLVSYFITGLIDEICLDVKIKQPNTLADTIRALHQIKPRPHFNRSPIKEARARREKGLYHYCDEKYVPGHHC
ncbi:hypothetical protein ACOSQ3_019847 [Xanthoceras sorbifolium]